GGSDRLGAEPMNRVGLEAENVARKMERADLPPAVTQHLVSAHRAADHLIEVFPGIVLAINLRIALESHRSAGHLECLAERIAPPTRVERLALRSNMPIGIAGNDLRG